MRLTLALALTSGLALSAPGWAKPPQGKPVTAGPKTPKAHATSTPKSHPPTAGPKTTSPAAGHKPATAGPKAKPPKATTSGASATPVTQTTLPKTNVPKNPKLAARLQGMLPAGMTVEQAALGFKNQGQFIAAVNVASNHGISFVDLKNSMVNDGLSLGQAIQKLKPTLDGDAEAAHALKLAEQELEPR